MEMSKIMAIRLTALTWHINLIHVLVLEFSIYQPTELMDDFSMLFAVFTSLKLLHLW